MKTVNYVILAGLMLKKRSGYDLARWLKEVAGHYYPVGHSSIYPALAELERRGLVGHEVVPSDRGPESKVYSLTGAGREELLGWVEEPTAETQVRDEQLVKALCYPYLPEKDALARVWEVKAYYTEKVAYYRELERRLKALTREGDISREAYLGMLLTLRRGVGAAESYVRWCDEAAGMISSAAAPHPAGGPERAQSQSDS